MQSTLQWELTGLGVGMVIVEILMGPINGDADCMRSMMFVFESCLNM